MISLNNQGSLSVNAKSASVSASDPTIFCTSV